MSPTRWKKQLFQYISLGANVRLCSFARWQCIKRFMPPIKRLITKFFNLNTPWFKRWGVSHSPATRPLSVPTLAMFRRGTCVGKLKDGQGWSMWPKYGCGIKLHYLASKKILPNQVLKDLTIHGDVFLPLNHCTLPSFSLGTWRSECSRHKPTAIMAEACQ